MSVKENAGDPQKIELVQVCLKMETQLSTGMDGGSGEEVSERPAPRYVTTLKQTDFSMPVLPHTTLPKGVTDLTGVKAELNKLSHVDLGDYLAGLPQEERALAFRLLNKDEAIATFEYLPADVQEELLGSMQDAQLRHVIESMSPDDRALLFDELPAAVVKRLLSHLSPKEREATATILGYEEGTAGRLMTTEYVRLRQGLTVGDAVSKIRAQDRDKETIYYAYVTDDNRKLVSVVSLRQLLFSIPTALVRDIASSKVVKVTTETPQEDVAQAMKRYDLLAIPVVDREERLVGIITIDDVVDVLEAEATEDFQKLAGLSGSDEIALDHPLATTRRRLPWLLGNVGLYIGAASAIAPFQQVISTLPVLAVLMPILSNTSGNVAIQTLTVTVRGLGVGEITPKDTVQVVRREVLAALGTALGLGGALMFLGYLWTAPENRWIAEVAGVVMGMNVIVAASLGTILPMGLKSRGLDPALISGPLLTTILDAIGFFTFLGCIAMFRGE